MAQLQDFPSCDSVVAQLDWRCGPCGQTRDSDALERSNFKTTVALLEEQQWDDDWEVITFNHWACGWVEEIFTRPGSKAEELVLLLRERLESYAVLDEADLAVEEEIDNLQTGGILFPPAEDEAKNVL